ncbi:MAG: hypothetical protein ACXITV_05700 [Luteibaculaceae bacterium]
MSVKIGFLAGFLVGAAVVGYLIYTGNMVLVACVILGLTLVELMRYSIPLLRRKFSEKK